MTRLFFLFIFFSTLRVTAQQTIYTVYLIGDSGAPKLDVPDPVFGNLQKRIETSDENSAIIFLGDNVYHNGLPPEDRADEDRKLAEKKLLVQLEAVDDFKGEIYFIPGNHDWNDAHSDGIDYIRAQEEFIEFFLDRGDVLIPDHGCPGPETKKLGDDVLLVAMDSQWWLHPHPDDPKANKGCKNKTKYDIITELKAILDEEDDKKIIIALHHPLFSNGSHSGDFPLKDHIFPLRLLNNNLFVPLPGLGSLYPFYRTAFGARQDMPHPLYQSLREEILEAIKPYQNVVLASGHEHNQQYYFERGNHFVKSGSGSKSSYLPNETNAVFSTEEKGYAQIDYKSDGSAVLRFFIIEDGRELELFNQQIIDPFLQFDTEGGTYDIDDEDIVSKASEKYSKGSFHRMLFGELYRDDWSQEVSFRSINLSKEKGGLKPIKIGGGFSSKSIRLKDDKKDQYVLRSIEKGVRKVVPSSFQGTLVEQIFQDQISSAQPYAALMVPPLADAVGVYHTNPEIVYLPKQPRLGQYNESLGGELYLFEERPYKDEREEISFGNSKKIISYTDLLDKLSDHSKHSIRQSQVLKSRLFDIFLGDWDRHDDQWRWARFKEKNYNGTKEDHYFYEPIPRDRDQVFYKYSGLIPALTKMLSPQTRKFQNFDEDIKNIPFLGYNARHFDRAFLSEMERGDWIEMANTMRGQLTDSVILSSINVLPEQVKNLRKEEYFRILTARRDKLSDFAGKHYDFLAKYVDVLGTDKRESFFINRNSDGSVHVEMYQRKKNGKLDDLMYERTFYNNETKEIRLYGLEGKDRFTIEGSQTSGPLIRIIGGPDEDQISDRSNVSGGQKSLVVYDTGEDNDFSLGNDAKDLRSDNGLHNRYDRNEFYYDQVIGIPFLGFNPDDGLSINYTNSVSKYGFRKLPYGSQHQFRIGVSTGRKQLSLGYDYHKVGAFGKADFRFESDFFLPSYRPNFFGLTNEQDFKVSDFEDFDFFRYEQNDIHIFPSIEWNTKRQVSRLQLGPYYRLIGVSDNDDKFIGQIAEDQLPQGAFDTRQYIGFKAMYHLHRVDNDLFPTSGIDFSFRPSYNVNVSNTEESFTQLAGDLTLYNYLFVPRSFVLVHRFSFGVNFGQFGFPLANYVGRDNGLRSFRSNRFGGRSSFVWSNDLRVKLFEVSSGALPFSFGLVGGYDRGRVWSDDEDSDTWHTSYGGGFWFSPFDVAPISAYYMTSPNATSQVIISLGFPF